MVQNESQSKQAGTNPLLREIPIDFTEAAKKNFEELANVQTELLDQFQEAQKQWLDRMQVEANLASEFVAKLSSARSIPDAMTACQEWGARRFAMASKDAKQALDNAQKFLKAATHLFANGAASKSPGLGS